MGAFPILDGTGVTPRIGSLLIKPASAVCNLDCSYCFYLDREADPYQALPGRRMTLETLERLVDSFLFYSYPASAFAFQGGAAWAQRTVGFELHADQWHPVGRRLVPDF
jgi:uncharacterized protein